ncbi:MAG: IS110 family transposase [Halobacteriovoraceae bacterium]|jgi:transposase|nr:IS110 family transposase [Halobacteriovoraceae bacterium]
MKKLSTIGIDLAKNIFQLHGADDKGNTLFRKRLARRKVIPFLVNLEPCLIGIEACGGSNYWAREIKKLGHDVKIIAPQFVKPYVKNDKTDENDAEAICEAVTRPNMRFVPHKKVEQQDMQNIHRIRERLIKTRTALINEARGLLYEYGIIIPTGRYNFKKEFPLIIADPDNELTMMSREIFQNLLSEYIALEERVIFYEQKIKFIHKNHPEAKRLTSIPGVGLLGATAILASVNDPHVFKNGREFAAWLGLVPRQHSSGGKQKNLGISKRGDIYLRKLLIHGARASLRWIDRAEEGKRKTWLINLSERKGKNLAAVALANKNARVIWALLVKQENYANVA